MRRPRNRDSLSFVSCLVLLGATTIACDTIPPTSDETSLSAQEPRSTGEDAHRDGHLEALCNEEWVWQELPRESSRYWLISSWAGDQDDVHEAFFQPDVPFVQITGKANTDGAAKITTHQWFNDKDLDDGTARADLAWAGIRYVCEDGPVIVKAYQRTGHSPGPFWDVEDSDYFGDKPSRYLAQCDATGFVGEHFVGHFRWPISFSGEFDEIDYELTRTFVSSWLDPIGAQWQDLVFGRADVRHVAMWGTAETQEENNFRLRIFGRTQDDDFLYLTDVNPGRYRLQADCGFGFQDIVPLEENATYQSDVFGLGAWDEFDMFAETFSSCDIRLGVYCSTELPPNHEVGPTFP